MYNMARSKENQLYDLVKRAAAVTRDRPISVRGPRASGENLRRSSCVRRVFAEYRSVPARVTPADVTIANSGSRQRLTPDSR